MLITFLHIAFVALAVLLYWRTTVALKKHEDDFNEYCFEVTCNCVIVAVMALLLLFIL